MLEDKKVEETNTEISIPQKHKNLPAWVLIIVFLVILTLVGAGYWWWTISLEPEKQPLVEFNLEEEYEHDNEQKQFSSDGFFYFSGAIDDRSGKDVSLNAHLYNLEFDVFGPVTDSGRYVNFVPLTDSEVALIRYTDLSPSHPDHDIPVIWDLATNKDTSLDVPSSFFERDIATARNGELIAYASRVSQDGEDFTAISNWQVIILDRTSGQVTIIPKAVSPEWIDNGIGLLHLKEDGPYIYELSSGIDFPLYTELTGYDASVQMAVSPNQQHVVLTMPRQRGIFSFKIVYAGDGQQLQPTGYFTTEDAISYNPVTDPYSQYFAVLAVQPEAEVPAAIDIRAFGNKEIVHSIPLNNYDYQNLRLDAWSDISFAPVEYDTPREE